MPPSPHSARLPAGKPSVMDTEGKPGQAGEKLAADFLKKHGYKILRRNYRAPTGEIDIIAYEGGDVVFVEVKSGASATFAAPESHVDRTKRRHMSQAALYFCTRKKLVDVNCRFDVVSVLIPAEGAPTCELYRNAFPLQLGRRQRRTLL